MPVALVEADAAPACQEPRFWDGVSDRDLARWRLEIFAAFKCERAHRVRGREDLQAQIDVRRGLP